MKKKEMLKILAQAKDDEEIIFQITCVNKEDKPYLTYIGSAYRDRKILLDFVGNRKN